VSLKKATYTCKRLFPRLELTTSESNLSSKNEFLVVRHKNTKRRAEQSETMLEHSDDNPIGCIKCIKTGGVGFKILFLAHLNPL